MPSSISNSEASQSSPSVFAAFVTVARAAFPTAIFASLAIGAALLIVAVFPRGSSLATIEGVIVDEQVARANNLSDVDVLVLGDSSALMGVDTTALSSALHGRAESLATLSFVGPRGYEKLLEEYAARGKRASILLLLMNGTALDLDEQTFAVQGFEARVLNGYATPDPSLRMRAYERVISPLIDFPLPGLYGTTYGWPDDLARSIRNGQGSITDPNQYVAPAGGDAYRFALSTAVESRLRSLGEYLSSANAKPAFPIVLFCATPLPDALTNATTLQTRADVHARVAALLNLQNLSLVDLPASLPAREFATQTHLNKDGRADYTAAVARALAPVLGPSGDH